MNVLHAKKSLEMILCYIRLQWIVYDVLYASVVQYKRENSQSIKVLILHNGRSHFFCLSLVVELCVLQIAQQQKQHLAIQFAAFLDAPFYCAKQPRGESTTFCMPKKLAPKNTPQLQATFCPMKNLLLNIIYQREILREPHIQP